MQDLLARIEQLEASAKRLEPDAGARKAIRDKVIAYTEDFLERIEDIPTFNYDHNGGMGLNDSPITDEPLSLDNTLELVHKEVDTPALNPASDGHLGYVPGGGIYTSSLGDYMADVTNRFAGVFYASPGAVVMENMLIRWMAEMVGYPTDCGGNLTSGGSIANLISIVTARDKKKMTGAAVEKGVIYASAHQHHCVDKAIRIAGLIDCQLRHIELDERYRIKPDDLQQKVEADKAAGLTPWLVIASAGTTDTGAIDPLDHIADIAEAHDLWYHIDGAYGAFFMLTEYGREKLKGIERSDSLVMDPHKGLFLPYGSGVVLVKDLEAMQESHQYDANYMQDTVDYDEEVSPADVSPELTKHFRGMRLWLPLKVHGLQPFRDGLNEKILLARYFRNEILQWERMEVGPEPELSIVFFRYLPETGDANAFNKKLIRFVNQEGGVFLSSTTLDGTFVIRLAALAFRTHKHTIDKALYALREGIRELTAQPEFSAAT